MTHQSAAAPIETQPTHSGGPDSSTSNLSSRNQTTRRRRAPTAGATSSSDLPRRSLRQRLAARRSPRARSPRTSRRRPPRWAWRGRRRSMPSTARISTASGKNDASSILKISSRAKVKHRVEHGQARDADAEDDPEAVGRRDALPVDGGAAGCRGLPRASRPSPELRRVGLRAAPVGVTLRLGLLRPAAPRGRWPAAAAAGGSARSPAAAPLVGSRARPAQRSPPICWSARRCPRSTSGLVSECQVRPIRTTKTIAGSSVDGQLADASPGADHSASRGPLSAPMSAGSTLSPCDLRDRRRMRRQRRRTRSLFGERRREVGLDLREDHHVADVEPGQHDPGEERAGVELHDRDARGGAVDDQHHRGRDQDAEAAARGDDARGDLDVVAGAQHRRHREQAHQRDHRARRCPWRWRTRRR